ncbi:MAG: sigma-70 family RNA polymerase sigma factor [Nocardioides sp.]
MRSDDDPTDAFADLLAAAQAGQPQALGELWSRFAGGVAGFARARGATDADEITNDVFLAVFTNIGAFNGDAGGFKALLFTIARRRVIDDLRRRGRQVPSTPWRLFEDRRTDEGPEDKAVARERYLDVLGHINRLTEDQRDVVLLRLVGELSIEEVAATLGKTPGSVKSLQRRGLDAVRRRWSEGAAANEPTLLTDPGSDQLRGPVA